MSDVFALAAQNVLSPMVLFFVLGLGAALARSDLTIPEAVAKAMALYLMMSIGFKGGAGMATHGLDWAVASVIGAGIVLSFVIPLIAFGWISMLTRLPRADRAAVSAHYGSISIVTFVAGSQALSSQGLAFEGYLVAVAAVMETPAIITALWLARSGAVDDGGIKGAARMDSHLLREILLNGSVVMLVGAFAIGWITGADGMERIKPFIVDPFQGVLCLFLLDMGLVAGRGLRDGGKVINARLVLFGITMPLIAAALAAVAALPLGLSAGGTAIFITLAASASYIAVPAAMRVALPEARPAVYLTLSLGVTFPFNLTIGIPLYLALGTFIANAF